MGHKSRYVVCDVTEHKSAVTGKINSHNHPRTEHDMSRDLQQDDAQLLAAYECGDMIELDDPLTNELNTTSLFWRVACGMVKIHVDKVCESVPTGDHYVPPRTFVGSKAWDAKPSTAHNAKIQRTRSSTGRETLKGSNKSTICSNVRCSSNPLTLHPLPYTHHHQRRCQRAESDIVEHTAAEIGERNSKNTAAITSSKRGKVDKATDGKKKTTHHPLHSPATTQTECAKTQTEDGSGEKATTVPTKAPTTPTSEAGSSVPYRRIHIRRAASTTPTAATTATSTTSVKRPSSVESADWIPNVRSYSRTTTDGPSPPLPSSRSISAVTRSDSITPSSLVPNRPLTAKPSLTRVGRRLSSKPKKPKMNGSNRPQHRRLQRPQSNVSFRPTSNLSDVDLDTDDGFIGYGGVTGFAPHTRGDRPERPASSVHFRSTSDAHIDDIGDDDNVTQQQHRSSPWTATARGISEHTVQRPSSEVGTATSTGTVTSTNHGSWRASEATTAQSCISSRGQTRASGTAYDEAFDRAKCNDRWESSDNHDPSTPYTHQSLYLDVHRISKSGSCSAIHTKVSDIFLYEYERAVRMADMKEMMMKADDELAAC